MPEETLFGLPIELFLLLMFIIIFIMIAIMLTPPIREGIFVYLVSGLKTLGNIFGGV